MRRPVAVSALALAFASTAAAQKPGTPPSGLPQAAGPSSTGGARTSTGIALPLRAGQHVRASSSAGRYTRTVDAASNTITYVVQQGDDRQDFFLTDIGDLPARVRIEFTGAVDGCSAATMGVAFGARVVGGAGLFTLAGINNEGSGGVYDFGPSGPQQVRALTFTRAAPFRHRFVVDVNGRAVSVSIDGGPAQTAQLDHEAAGFMGLSAAGGGCRTTFSNLTVSPLQ